MKVLKKRQNKRIGLSVLEENQIIGYTGYCIQQNKAYLNCPWDLFGIKSNSMLSNQIYVLGEFQGRGIGSFLFSNLISDLKTENIGILQVDQPTVLDWYINRLDYLLSTQEINSYELIKKGWKRLEINL